MTEKNSSIAAAVKPKSASAKASVKAFKPTKTKESSKRPSKSGKPSKQDKVLALLNRKNGGTQEEICKATGWQAHSVRGFLSGTCKKRMGLNVKSTKSDKGVRRYRITANDADNSNVGLAK